MWCPHSSAVKFHFVWTDLCPNIVCQQHCFPKFKPLHSLREPSEFSKACYMSTFFTTFQLDLVPLVLIFSAFEQEINRDWPIKNIPEVPKLSQISSSKKFEFLLAQSCNAQHIANCRGASKYASAVIQEKVHAHSNVPFAIRSSVFPRRFFCLTCACRESKYMYFKSHRVQRFLLTFKCLL